MAQQVMTQQALFAGLKVLDVGTWIAAPVATTMLADYGADVIKVEMPNAGDAYRQFAGFPTSPASPLNYTWLMDAHNKRSLTLNLKTDAGKEALLRLVTACDVYVTNQPLSMRRTLGLTYEALSALNPRMIYASLTAYGEHGPERDREGFDLVAYWSRPGLMDAVRASGAAPAQSLPGMGDHPTAVALYAAIVTALLRRHQTGEGSHVHTSLIQNGLWSASCIAQARLCDADFSPWRERARFSSTRALYETSDGRWLQFTMVRTPEEVDSWLAVAGLGALLADPRFATPEARLENGGELIRMLRTALITQPSAHWMAEFRAAGVPAALIGVLDDLPHDPQLEANGLAPAVDAPELGNPRLIRHPVNVDALARTPYRRPPELGEHTDSILRELGYSAEHIAEMRERGCC